MPNVNWLIRWVIDEASKKAAEDAAADSARKAASSQEAAAKHTGRTWEQVFTRVAEYVAAAFAVHRIIEFSREVFKLGVDMAETANKFTVAFGPAEKRVQAFVDKWGVVAGLNQSEAKDFLATTGAMAVGMGYSADAAADLAINVAKVAGDLTSLSNVPIEQTSRAVRSALVGEREELKTLGIAILDTDVQSRAFAMTGKKSADALTQQEKAAATLQLLYERIGPAAGDLERTQDSLANQLRRQHAEWGNLKIALGEVLVTTEGGPPIMRMMSDSIATATKYIKNHKGEIQEWAAVTATAVVGAIKAIVGFVRFLFNTGQVIGNLAEGTFRAILQGVSMLTNGVIDGLNIVIKAHNFLFGTHEKLIERLDNRNNLREMKRSFSDAGQNAMELGKAISGIAGAFDEVTAAQKRAKATEISVDTSGGTKGAGQDPKAAAAAAKAAAKDAKAVAEAEEKGVDALEKALQLHILTNEQRRIAIEALMHYQRIANDPNAPMDARIRAAGFAEQLKDASPLAPEAGNPKFKSFGMLPDAKRAQDAENKLETDYINLMTRIEDVSARTSEIITDHFERAFENLRGEFGDVTTLAAAAFTAIGQMGAEAVAEWAQRKVKENLIAAGEAVAYALGLTAVGNFGSAGQAWASAAKHTAIAAAWGALAGAGAAGAGALGGGGAARGGVTSGQAGITAAGRTNNQPTTEITVHVDGFDKTNGRHLRIFADGYVEVSRVDPRIPKAG